MSTGNYYRAGHPLSGIRHGGQSMSASRESEPSPGDAAIWAGRFHLTR